MASRLVSLPTAKLPTLTLVAVGSGKISTLVCVTRWTVERRVAGSFSWLGEVILGVSVRIS